MKGDKIMTYKYKSVLKSFQYSKENYKIISDFLLSGDKENPDILLNVTKVSKEFGKVPNEWFRLSSTINFIKALVEIKIKSNDKKLRKVIKKFIKDGDFRDTGNSRITSNDYFSGFIESLEQKELIKLIKLMGLLSIKKGNAKGSNDGKSLKGTWIHRDLAIKYAEWLDPKFSIWISQKIQELISDGVAWNEIRDATRIDYKPLTQAIAKYIIPQYPYMDKNIVYGRIANFINLKVIGQKAKEIREEKGIEPSELTRDFFTKEELNRIEKLQIFTEILISQFEIYTFKELEERINLYKFKY
jgi:hypothetical protein